MDIQKLNFSHDLALASNAPRYTPPPNVQLMERDLAPLVRLLPEAPLRYAPDAPVWGWNRSFVADLRRAGHKDLPTPDQLADIRRLSSRLTAVEMLPALRQRLSPDLTVGESQWISPANRVPPAPLKGGDTSSPFRGIRGGLLKAPFSGSGRGLRLVRGALTDKQLSWARRCVREQGGVVVEPYYNKVLDFALEFLSTPDGVDYLGLSVFATNANNVYAGNVIAPQQDLLRRVSDLLPALDFPSLVEAVRAELAPRFISHYLGPLGVDMMIVEGEETSPFDHFTISRFHNPSREEDSSPCQVVKSSNCQMRKLHPCVEVNVRRTMGELSLHLLPLLADGSVGFFRLLFGKSHAALVEQIERLPAPVYDAGSRLVSGARLLTPLTPVAQYAAVLEV